jgi:DNA-binding GntR family transcriptional regulator
VKTDQNKRKKENLAEEAVVKLQQAIMSGELRPNQRLVEKQLSQKYGMSRTPIHEAIRRLEQMGHVTVLENGKASVTELTQSHIRDLYETREALEIKVIELDCARATDAQIKRARELLDLAAKAAAKNDLEAYGSYNTRFHNILLESCRNDKLISIVKTVRDQLYLVNLTRFMTRAELNRVIKQHYLVIDAIGERKTEKAQKAFLKLIRLLSKFPETRI